MMHMMFCFGILLLVTVFVKCDSDSRDLEKQSIFYGITLVASKNGTDSECIRQLSSIEEGIRKTERWAVKLLDASGYPEAGFYWGNNYWLGSKSQCGLSTSLRRPNISPDQLPYTEDTPQTVATFPVAYFAAYFFHNSTFQIFTHWDNETKMTLGLCLPSVCREDLISDLLQEYFDTGVLNYQHLYNASFKIDTVIKTGADHSWMYHPIAIVFISSTLVIAVFVVLGTAYDLIIYQPALEAVETAKEASKVAMSQIELTQDSEIKPTQKDTDEAIKDKLKTKLDLNMFEKIILSFSWYTNFNQVFTIEPTPGVLMPIIGIRFFLTILVIIAHSYLFVMDYFINRAYGTFLNYSHLGQIFSNSSYYVDVYFLLGGFLMFHGAWRSKELADESNHTYRKLFQLFRKAVAKRFRRITPVYLYILCLTYSASASNRTSVAKWTNERNDLQCPKYWWTNVLYINNIYPGTNSGMCMSWSYYLSNDMQFFVWISFLFYLSKMQVSTIATVETTGEIHRQKCVGACQMGPKHFKSAVVLLIATFTGSLTVLGTVAYFDQYKPYQDTFFPKAPLFYYPPWTRIGPYIIGACFSYLYNKLNGKLILNKITVGLFWAASISSIVYLELGFTDRNFSIYMSVLHTMLSRNVFALAGGWMLISCLTGYGGAANTLFSARGWLPFSNLAYTAYLLNPVIIYLLISNSEKGLQLETTNVTLYAFGVIGLTFFCSIFVVISVEYPIVKVLNIFFAEEHREDNPPMKKEEASREIKKALPSSANRLEKQERGDYNQYLFTSYV